MFSHFIVSLHKGCCFVWENQHISQIGFVVTRTENRASKFIMEKTFVSKALKIAAVLLKQPAFLKLRAVA